MDQTGLYYEVIYTKTIKSIGSKRVVVANKDGERKRAAIFFLINCAGQRLKPLMVMRGTGCARIQNTIQQEDENFN